MKARTLDFYDTGKSNSFVLVIVAIISVIIAVFPIRCSPAGVTPLPTVPTIPQSFEPPTMGDLEAGGIEESLTKNKWQNVSSPETNLAPEIVTWEFYSNGMFRRQFTSDFSEERLGAWSISPTSEESGVIFLASTMNDPHSLDALSFRFENGRLELGEFSYEAVPFTSADAPPAVIEQDLLAVTGQHDRFFSWWTTITATDWQNKSTPPPGDANLYSFMQDGSYTAHFDTTRCQYSGTWSISFLGGDSGVIWLSVPANACDPRGAQEMFVREIPIRLNGDDLILYETVYVPAPKRR